MKSLFNVSPFILLLFPAFVMMILTFATNADHTDQASAVAKTTVTTAASLDKASGSIAK
ncbi:hypothetical protein AY601_4315 [Pedobacter cryoconitis]|uniref:Uncharacterized protein n=1 Tax=Pedobacter cryoconitis TaxID=188932 RepID=A0A127VIR9_9SPHI|nr:hypothetical protein [Pedobacter cryoconitis]AMQ01162.1 hypothetical protein AY601_4315 [Pedobacter cryoconitis]